MCSTRLSLGHPQPVPLQHCLLDQPTLFLLFNMLVPPEIALHGTEILNLHPQCSCQLIPHCNSVPVYSVPLLSVITTSQPSVITAVCHPSWCSWLQHWLSSNPLSAHLVLCTCVPTPPGTTTTGGNSLTHTHQCPPASQETHTHTMVCTVIAFTGQLSYTVNT